MRFLLLLVFFLSLPLFSYGFLFSQPSASLTPAQQHDLADFKQRFMDLLPAAEQTSFSMSLFDEVYHKVLLKYVISIDDSLNKAMLESAYEGAAESKRVQERLNRTPSGTRLMDAAIKAMMPFLDPHSAYMTPSENKHFSDSIRGHYDGIGVALLPVADSTGLEIQDVFANSPAAKAGLLKRDIIVQVADTRITSVGTEDALHLLRGKRGTSVVIHVLRDKEERSFTILRDTISSDAVALETLGDGYYVLVIPSFHERVGTQMRTLMATIAKDSVRGFVLDLRGNPGGLLNQATLVADMFLSKGLPLTSIRGRDDDETMRFVSGSSSFFPTTIPMVILVDDLSASASEIVAAALQENKRSIIMGTPTYGKGSVQVIEAVKGGGGLRLTTQLYYTPLGYTIQGKGVIPDIILKPDGHLPSKKERDFVNMLSVLNISPFEARLTLSEGYCLPYERGQGDSSLRLDYAMGCALEYLKAGDVAFVHRMTTLVPPDAVIIP